MTISLLLMAGAGESVCVTFAGQEKTAVADAGGKWRVNTMKPIADY